MLRRSLLTGMAGMVGLAGTAQAQDLNSLIKAAQGLKTTKAQSSSAPTTNLKSSDADAGLRQTLNLGTVAAVTRLSKPDGYWADQLVQIALPGPFKSAQSLLKPLGQSGMLDELHESMNHAAEKAAPVAKGLFLDAIKSITLKDAVGIIRGGPTSGTEYLHKSTGTRLTELFLPSMGSALENTGAVHALNQAITRNKLGGYVKQDPKTYLSHYAVGKALDGLFFYIGQEEKSIRSDPSKRTTALLKTVFGG